MSTRRRRPRPAPLSWSSAGSSTPGDDLHFFNSSTSSGSGGIMDHNSEIFSLVSSHSRSSVQSISSTITSNGVCPSPAISSPSGHPNSRPTSPFCRSQSPRNGHGGGGSSTHHSPRNGNSPRSHRSPLGSPRSPSSPRGLAYLASRRSSRDSQATTGTQIDDNSPLPSPGAYQRHRQRRQSNFLELPVVDYVRPRVCSLPEGGYNPRTGPSGDELYRLRTFNITDKGSVVNCGDSLIPRRSRSNTSMASTNSNRQSNLSGERSPFEGSCCGSSAVSTDSEGCGEGAGDPSLGINGEKLDKFRLVLLGHTGVGKSALVSQFMTSEYINTYDVSLDDEFGERTVSVLLDEKESELVFVDHPCAEMSAENCIATYEPHGCIVVYSVTDKRSFKAANEILRYLWQERITKDKAVILVANKCDLARARVITTQEGKSLARAHDCKFIETSSGIQHNVDELLVGALKQCRLRESRLKKEEKMIKNQRKLRLNGSRTSLSLHLAKEILGKLCLQNSKSKSCENLHVL